MKKYFEELLGIKESVLALRTKNENEIDVILRENLELEEEIQNQNEKLIEGNKEIESTVVEVEIERLENLIKENEEVIKDKVGEVEKETAKMFEKVEEYRNEVNYKIEKIETNILPNIKARLSSYEELKKMEVLKNSKNIQNNMDILNDKLEKMESKLLELKEEMNGIEKVVEEYNNTTEKELEEITGKIEKEEPVVENREVVEEKVEEVEKTEKEPERENNKDRISIDFDIATGTYNVVGKDNSFTIKAFENGKNFVLPDDYKLKMMKELEKMGIPTLKVKQLDPMVHYILSVMDDKALKEDYIIKATEKEELPIDLKYNMVTKVNGEKRKNEAKIGFFKRLQLNRIARKQEKMGAKVERNIKNKFKKRMALAASVVTVAGMAQTASVTEKAEIKDTKPKNANELRLSQEEFKQILDQVSKDKLLDIAMRHSPERESIGIGSKAKLKDLEYYETPELTGKHNNVKDLNDKTVEIGMIEIFDKDGNVKVIKADDLKGLNENQLKETKLAQLKRKNKDSKIIVHIKTEEYKEGIGFAEWTEKLQNEFTESIKNEKTNTSDTIIRIKPDVEIGQNKYEEKVEEKVEEKKETVKTEEKKNEDKKVEEKKSEEKKVEEKKVEKKTMTELIEDEHFRD